MAIFSVRFLWRARTRGDFPIQSSTWRVKVNRLKPRAPILYTYTEHAQFVDVSIDIRARGEMDWKRNDIHRNVVFDPCLRHVTS